MKVDALVLILAKLGLTSRAQVVAHVYERACASFVRDASRRRRRLALERDDSVLERWVLPHGGTLPGFTD